MQLSVRRFKCCCRSRPHACACSVATAGAKDQAASRIFLTDALNSVIAQMSDSDDSSLQTSYAYSPYGASTTVGTDPANNPIQYTSRENDGTGLYYYRARYYDPVLGRFVSEDPIGLAGGIFTSASFNAITQLATTGCINWGQLAVQTGYGVVGNSVGGAVGKYFFNAQINSSWVRGMPTSGTATQAMNWSPSFNSTFSSLTGGFLNVGTPNVLGGMQR